MKIIKYFLDYLTVSMLFQAKLYQKCINSELVIQKLSCPVLNHNT